VATEEAIQALLRLRDSGVVLGEIMPAFRPEDSVGAVCYKTTPELHAGYQAGLFGSALGNFPDNASDDAPVVYTLPDKQNQKAGQFYVEGVWQALPETMTFAGSETGKLLLPYEAVGVNGVLSPVAGDEGVVLVQQDGVWLDGENAGKDIQFDDLGRSFVTLTRPRMYELVQNPDFGLHTLELTFKSQGSAVYAFTFTSCVMA
jgi:hypothetical protein